MDIMLKHIFFINFYRSFTEHQLFENWRGIHKLSFSNLQVCKVTKFQINV